DKAEGDGQQGRDFADHKGEDERQNGTKCKHNKGIGEEERETPGPARDPDECTAGQIVGEGDKGADQPYGERPGKIPEDDAIEDQEAEMRGDGPVLAAGL